MVSNTIEDIEISVDDSGVSENLAFETKRRRLENGNSLSDKEDSELQVVDDDIDVSGPAPTFIEEVMDEGGGDMELQQDSNRHKPPATVSETAAPLEQHINNSTPGITTAPPTPTSGKDTTVSVSLYPNTSPSSTTPSSSSTTGYIRSTSGPPNVTAIPLMMPNISSVGGTVASPSVGGTAATTLMMPNMSSLGAVTLQQHTSPNMLPSPTPVSNLSNPSSVVQSLMSSVSSGNLPNLNNNIANNFSTSQSSGSGVPNPVGITAHALLETLLAQVIAHSMNGNAGTGGAGGMPPTTPTTSTVPFSPTIPNVSEGAVPKAVSPASPPLVVTPTTPSIPLQNPQEPLKETLDKINLLEQNTASLDKQSAGIQRMVTEVVKKQEENTTAAGTICPRCKHMVGGGEQFISHLLARHNFVEQKGPLQKADFGSQAGLGTCRGWRYIRTKNSGTQSTLSMVGKGDKQVIDLTSTNISPPPDQPKSGVLPSPTPNHPPEPVRRASPSAAHPNLSPRGVGYDSARATAANILSFVFSNPDVNKQFTDFAELPKEVPAMRSPKKQFPPNYGHLPFLQTINKQLQQHNGLALFDRMKEVKPVSPIIANAQQKELMAHALKQQQQQQSQQLHAQQLHQQHLQQQQQLQQAAQLARHPAQAAQQRAALHAPIMHPAANMMQSSMQPIQPIQPTAIQASSLQQIRPHGSNFPAIPPPPMISVGELKDQYQQMISGGGPKINAFDENSDGPLKDCIPKVRASLVNGDIQLMWNIIGDERKCTGYRLFAYMGATAPPISSTWTEVGTVKALPMPMAVTLSQFSKGCSYHFTVRAIDAQGNLGPFSEPCSIKLSL